MTRPGWDFDYAPLSTYGALPALEDDLIAATVHDADPARMVAALSNFATSVAITPLLNVHPLFWFRIQFSAACDRLEVAKVLERAGIGVRYVASAKYGSLELGVPPEFDSARPRRARDWKVRGERGSVSELHPGDWFIGKRGVGVDRAVCGSGAGTRLAVIDNDGCDTDKLELDAEICVGVEKVPRSASHAALMVGWAVGAKWTEARRYSGIAPAASPRFYCIPKPGECVFHLPLAIARAADDGADVIVCATYTEGQTSPMLDDALEFATRLGRGGRGTAVIFAASRELSSPPDSVHASLSLGLAEPASDPRVFCLGPSSPEGNWFLWRDRKGRLHPFANRGPALRWLAPGDDLTYPLADRERLVHGESSGAASVAAGVLLLVLANNPELTLDELEELLSATAQRVDPAPPTSNDLADPHDLLPHGLDPDGHNAKHGYGKLDAALACAAACDPIAAALGAIGERRLGLAFARANPCRTLQGALSPALARWLARAFLVDQGFRHAASVVARCARLMLAHPNRVDEQPPGALLRQVGVALRRLLQRGDIPADARGELSKLVSALADQSADREQAVRLEKTVWVALRAISRADERSRAVGVAASALPAGAQS